MINLPSGNKISGETWGWIVEDGDWRPYLDERMYPAEDRDHMDKLLTK